MASNQNEVLDPAAPVEKLNTTTEGRPMNRRDLLTGLGMAGAAVGAGLVSMRSAGRPSVVQASTTFSQIDYLNFLLNIKYLKATFYSYITQGTDVIGAYTIPGGTSTIYHPVAGAGPIASPYAKVTFSGANAAQITDMMNEIYYDEVNHLIDLQGAISQNPANIIGQVAIVRPGIDLSGTNTTIPSVTSGTLVAITSSKALAVARLLEDVSVTAYAGVAPFLTGSNLTLASQILGAEGLHAGAIRLAIILQNTATPGTVVYFPADSSLGSVQSAGVVQSDDVAPVDPGSAAAAALGPAVLTGTTVNLEPCYNPVPNGALSVCPPTEYQGFFSTAGNPLSGNPGTASGSTPPGFAFARTTSQVLSILLAKGPTPTATGTSGQFTIVVSSAGGIVVGQTASGTGIGSGATVTAVSGTTVTLSVANSAAVAGTVVTFVGLGDTPVYDSGTAVVYQGGFFPLGLNGNIVAI